MKSERIYVKDIDKHIIFFLGGGCAEKIRWRLIFAILGCAGMAITYGLKVNLSVAIVAMVNQVIMEFLPVSDKSCHWASFRAYKAESELN